MLTETLARYIAAAGSRALPPEVEQKTALHLLDTIAAIVSGSQLSAGRAAIAFIREQGGAEQATVFGGRFRTSAINAAHAHGMMAHADETDDSHAPSLTHPGCAIVPAAMALAEHTNATGAELLRAIAAGYDIGTRIAMTLGGGRFFDQHHSSHAFGGLFGATAAGSVASRFDANQAAAALAYAVQMASGNTCWRRDPNHVEKAFIFGGMPARNGVLAVAMTAAGFRGSSQPIEGNPGLLAAFPHAARSELATEALGERFEVVRTTIKKWCVGSPIQSALDSMSALMVEHGVTAGSISEIVVTLPKRRAAVVQNPTSPDLNIGQQLAVLLIDGSLTFAATHDHERMQDPEVVCIRSLVKVVPHDGDPAGQPTLEVRLSDGRSFERQTLDVKGSPGNPMGPTEVIQKAFNLMAPLLGDDRARSVCGQVVDLASAEDLSRLVDTFS
jgi:2-methylcitrate dehydratase PrpD